MTTTAAIISVGDELLSGTIKDENTSFLLEHLNQQGIKISFTMILPDELNLIAQFLKPLPQQVDWIFITGGLGPTHDDITLEAIAAAFDVPLETHPRLKQKIRHMFGSSCTEDHFKMAKIPVGTELIDLPDHKIPIIKFKNIFVLPGVPELMQYLFLQIKDRFTGSGMLEAELFLDADEGVIAQDLKKVIDQFKGLKIGSYPTNPTAGYRIRLHLRHEDRKTLEDAVGVLKNALKNYLIDELRC